ncbi:MAG: flagellar basal body-associated FliL family protein [Pseudobdellovibrionaceae bacterium]
MFLKDKIAKEINTILDQGVVKNVYFSDFVVQ